MQRTALAACYTFAVSAIPATAISQTAPSLIPEFRVQVAASDGTQTIRSSESFAVESEPGSKAALEAIAPDGTHERFDARIEPDGELVPSSTDQFLTCYNLALRTMSALDRHDGPAQLALQASFSGIPIPLAIQAVPVATAGNGERLIKLAGESDGSLVSKSTSQTIRTTVSFEGELVVSGRTLRAATFAMSTFAGTPLRSMGGTSCLVETQDPASTPVESGATT